MPTRRQGWTADGTEARCISLRRRRNSTPRPIQLRDSSEFASEKECLSPATRKFRGARQEFRASPLPSPVPGIEMAEEGGKRKRRLFTFRRRQHVRRGLAVMRFARIREREAAAAASERVAPRRAAPRRVESRAGTLSINVSVSRISQLAY
jgi:hypothetical protein